MNCEWRYFPNDVGDVVTRSSTNDIWNLDILTYDTGYWIDICGCGLNVLTATPSAENPEVFYLTTNEDNSIVRLQSTTLEEAKAEAMALVQLGVVK